MASQPDAHPDSEPDGPSDSPEQVTPAADPGRENVEGVPDDFDDAGVTGGGNEERDQDSSDELGFTRPAPSL